MLPLCETYFTAMTIETNLNAYFEQVPVLNAAPLSDGKGPPRARNLTPSIEFCKL